MSGSNRYYKRGVREALFMASRGHCYAPKCSERVLRLVDGDPIINVDIAHIKGLKVGSARHDRSLPTKELNRYRNLILLCTTHHGPVDDKFHEDRYTVDVLLEWKKDREGDFFEELAGLEVLSTDDLEEMLVDAFAETKQEILQAIEQVTPLVSSSVVTTLSKLIEETFDQPYVDIDAAIILADAASSLEHLPDSASILSEAATAMRPMEDIASTLLDAARSAKNLESVSEVLIEAARISSQLIDATHSYSEPSSSGAVGDGSGGDITAAANTLSGTVYRVEIAARSLENTTANLLGFRRGLIVGVIGSAIFALLIFALSQNTRG